MSVADTEGVWIVETGQLERAPGAARSLRACLLEILR